ncbi:MAG: TIGR04255 family protein [Capsulimonadaceae bacterium]
MTDYPTWQNPPIVQAILEIRADVDASCVGELKNVVRGIEDQFPHSTEVKQGEFQLAFNPEAEPGIHTPPISVIGYNLTSQDQQSVVGAWVPQFSYSQLKAYSTWAEFSTRARDMYDRYISIARPTSVTRLGLRYINRLALPLPVDNFKDYILTAPDVAEGIPQSLLLYFMRLVIPDPDIDAIANVLMSLEPLSEESTHANLVFDIDVSKQGGYPATNSEEMWRDFAQLREFKNRIFYKSLTEKTKEMFR